MEPPRALACLCSQLPWKHLLSSSMPASQSSCLLSMCFLRTRSLYPISRLQKPRAEQHCVCVCLHIHCDFLHCGIRQQWQCRLQIVTTLLMCISFMVALQSARILYFFSGLPLWFSNVSCQSFCRDSAISSPVYLPFCDCCTGFY